MRHLTLLDDLVHGVGQNRGCIGSVHGDVGVVGLVGDAVEVRSLGVDGVAVEHHVVGVNEGFRVGEVLAHDVDRTNRVAGDGANLFAFLARKQVRRPDGFLVQVDVRAQHVPAAPPRREDDACLFFADNLLDGVRVPRCEVSRNDALVVPVVEHVQGFLRAIHQRTIDDRAVFLLLPQPQRSAAHVQEQIAHVAAAAVSAGEVRQNRDAVSVILAVAVHVVLHERQRDFFQIRIGLGCFQTQLVQPVLTNPHDGAAVKVHGHFRDAVDAAVDAQGIQRAVVAHRVECLQARMRAFGQLVGQVSQQTGLHQCVILVHVHLHQIRDFAAGDGSALLLVEGVARRRPQRLRLQARNQREHPHAVVVVDGHAFRQVEAGRVDDAGELQPVKALVLVADVFFARVNLPAVAEGQRGKIRLFRQCQAGEHAQGQRQAQEQTKELFHEGASFVAFACLPHA